MPAVAPAQGDREGGVEAIAMLAETRRARLRHVHLVRTDDLRAFLDGELVRSRQIPRWWSGTTVNQTSRRR
jgi:hypothetical protein